MKDIADLETQYTALGTSLSILNADNDSAVIFSQQISEEIKSLSQQREFHIIQINELLQEKQILEAGIKYKQEQMLDLTNNIDALSSSSKATARASFEQYCESLDAEYTLKEQEFDADLENLDKLYEDQHDALLREMSEDTARANEQKEQLNRDLDIIRRELEKIRATRAATMDAQLREQEIKDKATFYTIQLNEADKRDVAYLQSIEYNLREARPLRMLIWTTFYRDKVNDLAARVGAVGATGIYKITHIDSGISYVGQARDIKERWVTHIKCSLGIDTPVTSQLYAFTREKGIDNFTFEILEKCSANELNEKEKFYIDLYQTYDYGLNKTRGNS
jgi:chromosome segregation ATPase